MHDSGPGRTGRFCVRGVSLLLALTMATLMTAMPGMAGSSRAQPTPVATPRAGQLVPPGSRVIVGHSAGLIANIPDGWMPDPSLRFDYASPSGASGEPGFFASAGIDDFRPFFTAIPTTLEDACAMVAAGRWFGAGSKWTPATESATVGTVSMIEWEGQPACEIVTSDAGPDQPVARVTTSPHPAVDRHDAFVAVVADREHADDLFTTVSFDLDLVTPSLYVDGAIDLLQTHAVLRDRLDWTQVREQAQAILREQGSASGFNGAHVAVAYVVSRLQAVGSGAHTRLMPRGFGDSAGAATTFPMPKSQLVADGIGFLTMPTFSGTDEQAQQYARSGWEAIAGVQEQGACSWIIDLRMDGGGDVSAMIGAVSQLVAPGRMYGYRDANGTTGEVTLSVDDGIGRDGRFPTTRIAAPADLVGTASSQRVVVLVGPATMSAAEMLLLSLAQRGNVTVMGLRTGGELTEPDNLHLIDGALLRVSARWATGPLGAIYPGGITPDIVMGSDLSMQHPEGDAITMAAIDWLQQQESCA